MRLADLIVTQCRVAEAYDAEVLPSSSEGVEFVVVLPRAIAVEMHLLAESLELTPEQFIRWAVSDVVREVTDVK